MLQVLAKHGLVSGKTIGVDATTLEANAAMRSIVRRDTGESYNEFLMKLAQASGIETPTREELAKLDRQRPKKGSNEEWEHPDDPDAKITKMKDRPAPPIVPYQSGPRPHDARLQERFGVIFDERRGKRLIDAVAGVLRCRVAATAGHHDARAIRQATNRFSLSSL